jgi:DNA (cytosine-5)-methyltransferase 1
VTSADVTTEQTTALVSSTFEMKNGRLERTIVTPGITSTTSIAVDLATADPLGDWWQAYLRGDVPNVEDSSGSGPVSTVELFCGPGGLAQGFQAACHELGFESFSRAAVDHDPEAVDVYERNHRPLTLSSRSVTEIIDYRVKRRGDSAEFRYDPEFISNDWIEHVGQVDVVLAGPPCQGHSNLNNHSRRDDKRNDLYLSVPAVAIALNAPVVIIENVPAVVHDRLGVVAATIRLLETAGYAVTTGVLKADQMGWAQRRSRFFLIARRDREPLDLETVGTDLTDTPRPLQWAIGDLAKRDADDHMFRRAEMSEENRSRIDYLFDHDLHNLPNSERPDCHKDGTTYTSVYGRLFEDKPAPTITTGFMTPGRGRYIHPTERRVITPAEAARLQGFPDTYKFDSRDGGPPSSLKLSKWIGDAVPMPLGHAAGLSALGMGPVSRDG